MSKNKKFILFILFLFISIGYVSYTNTVFAGCSIDCIGNTTASVTGAPVKCEYDIDIWPTSNKICTIGSLNTATAIFSTVSPCYNSDTNATPSPNTQACRHDVCPDFNYQNGAICEIISADGIACGNEYKSAGKWDQSEKKCVKCSGKKEGIICGDLAGIYENVGTCNGVNSTSFETACDATVAASCDDKNQGDACAGGTCDANGFCVAGLVLTITTVPASGVVEKNEAITVNYKVTDGTNPIQGANLTGRSATGGTLTGPACSTNPSGICQYIYTAGSTAGTYAAIATKASKTGYDDSVAASAPITIVNVLCDITDCSGKVSFDCDCRGESAIAGVDYCCDAATSSPYVFGSQASCNSACASCTPAQTTEMNGGSSGNCNSGDNPCVKMTNRTPGVRIKYNEPSRTLDLFNPSGTYQSSFSAGSGPGSTVRGDVPASCMSGIWTLKMQGTTCAVSAISSGTCPSACGPADGSCPGGCTNPPDPDCPPACTPTAWSAWSACVAGSKTRTRAIGCGGPTSQNQSCCTVPNEAVDCSNPALPKCKASTEACVACITSADCAVGEVCDLSNNCIPCTGEGAVSTDPLLCCAGLSWWDIDDDGNNECTSKCDPEAYFFCNTIRGTVDTIVQGGEKMIGYILGLIGSVALLLVIISGIMYMTAAGVEEKITSAKRILTGAVIGLGIALLAFSLLQVVLSVLNM